MPVFVSGIDEILRDDATSSLQTGDIAIKSTAHLGPVESTGSAQFACNQRPILWVLICLANQTGVDLTEALQQSIEKKTKRDKERHKNNPKLQ